MNDVQLDERLMSQSPATIAAALAHSLETYAATAATDPDQRAYLDTMRQAATALASRLSDATA